MCINCACALFVRYSLCLIAWLHQLVNFGGEDKRIMRYFFSISFSGKNHLARSERLSPLTLVSGWGEGIWKTIGVEGERWKNNCVTWNDVESSCVKVEESNAFSLSLSFPYWLPSLAFFSLQGGVIGGRKMEETAVVSQTWLFILLNHTIMCH